MQGEPDRGRDSHLQLANFWQDVTVDLLKDRIYIPLAAMESRGCAVEDVYARFAHSFGLILR